MWILVLILALLISLGASGLIGAFLVGLCTLLGGLLLCYLISRHRRTKFYLKSWTSSLCTENSRSKKNDSPCMRISGHPDIDAIIGEILQFVFRDHIHSWHSHLNHSKAFSHSLGATTSLLLKSLSFQVQKIDWIPYLTTKLVDDVASHVRLFKKARRLLKKAKMTGDRSKLPDLESFFFDSEAMMEGNICRDLVCTIHQEENAFLQDIAELMLFLLLPPEDFETNSFRILTRELLVNVVLKPTFDLISDPDFINSTIIRIYMNYTIKPDVFSLTIRYSESLDELQAVRKCRKGNQLSSLQ
eukprot:TRINITY_DN8769_c0_g1_i1.p1 TRINITY_DN8769_c0_g1~~TRINITY_DN8769_c0_g1_i1.p1  ORF type:complete len:301 (-),score=54.84 TRINITY_DN8769_c0_g1_i1:37-939(-)